MTKLHQAVRRLWQRGLTALTLLAALDAALHRQWGFAGALVVVFAGNLVMDVLLWRRDRLAKGAS